MEKRQAEAIPLVDLPPLTGLVEVCLNSQTHLLHIA